MIGFGAMAGAAGEAGPRSRAGHCTASEAGGLYANDECGRSVLYNTTTERPWDQGARASLSVASMGWSLVHIHEVIEKAGGEVFRCSPRWFEVQSMVRQS